MTKNYPFAEIQEKLASAQKVLVALPASPKYDQMAGALALSLSLQGVGKQTVVVCPSPVTVEYQNLVGVDKVVQKANGTDLVVSLNYLMDNVEKISYNDDNGRLNLVIQPKAGAPILNEKEVNFSFAGTGAEIVFTVGIKNVNQLTAIGLNSVNPEMAVNIDNQPDNTNFAVINVIDVDSPSFSEIVLGLLSGLGLPADLDISQNILNGIWRVTQGLKRADIGPDAYEAVAACLRMGAQRPVDTQPPSLSHETPKPKQKVWPPKEEKSAPPADWFSPKIYRGASNV